MRLIDADELYGDFIDGTEGYDCQTWNRIEIGDIIEDAPTIIEADNGDGNTWHDIPTDEMSVSQLRAAVKDLRKKLAEVIQDGDSN